MTPKNDDGYEGNGVNLLSEYHKPGAGFVPVEYKGEMPEWLPDNQPPHSTAAGWLGFVVAVALIAVILFVAIGLPLLGFNAVLHGWRPL